MNVKVENLNYTYAKGTPFSRVALKNISLEIKAGEFIGLIGHSGSGKSTLVQHLNGLIPAQEGNIFIGDKLITGKNADRKSLCFDVGLVFQYPEQQLFAETVFDDIAFGPKNMGLNDVEVELRVNTAAELAGIKKDLLKKSPFSLSGGQKRRVAIAGVIAMEPGVLILDEPTAGLDPKGRNETLDSIRKIHRQMNMTVILVSHSMEDVAKYCDRLIVLNGGEVKLSGTKEEVFSHSKELTEIGLSVPQVTLMAEKLKEKGIDLGDDVFTVSDVKAAILEYLKGKKDA